MAGLVRADIYNVVPLLAQILGYRLLHVIAGVIRSNYDFHAEYLAYKKGDGRKNRPSIAQRCSAAGVFHGALPEFDKLTSAAALMQPGKLGDTAADVMKTFRECRIAQAAGIVETSPGLRNRHLLGNHPRVQRSPDAPQRIERIERAEPPRGDTDQSDHFPLELIESHQVQRIF